MMRGGALLYTRSEVDPRNVADAGGNKQWRVGRREIQQVGGESQDSDRAFEPEMDWLRAPFLGAAHESMTTTRNVTN